jgi:hypothetical protein
MRFVASLLGNPAGQVVPLALFPLEDIGNALIETLVVDRNMDEQKVFRTLFNSNTYEQLARSDTFSVSG